MKKLFFAALVATVAVGGALSTNAAPDVRGVTSGYLYNCSIGTTTLCSSISESIVLESDHSQSYNVANFINEKYD